MRLLLVIILIASLIGPGGSLRADDRNEQYLAQCKMQLGERYGAEADIKLVSIRRSGNGLRLKVAVRLSPATDGLERVEFTSCRVEKPSAAGSAQPKRLLPSVPG